MIKPEIAAEARQSFSRFVPGEATLQRDPEVPNDQNSPPAKTVAWASDSLRKRQRRKDKWVLHGEYR